MAQVQKANTQALLSGDPFSEEWKINHAVIRVSKLSTYSHESSII